MACSNCQCGHGKAHKPHGASHWMAERLTSIALIPLCLWAVWSAVTLAGASYAAFTAWLAVPMNAGLLAALVVVGFWHGVMGLQVVIEDYVATLKTRNAIICLMKLIFSALALACLYSIYTIAF